MPRKRHSSPFSLFAFQDIITSVTGIILLLTLILTLELSQRDSSSMPLADAAIVAGAWIYVTGDDAEEHAYEVASVSDPTITLFLPFEGTEGSGKTLVVMKSAPVWGAAACFAFDITLNGDSYWRLQGISFKSSDSTSLFDFNSVVGLIVKDCIITTTTATEIYDGGSSASLEKIFIIKSRHIDYEAIIDRVGQSNYNFDRCLFDGNGAGEFMEVVDTGRLIVTQSEMKGHSQDIEAPFERIGPVPCNFRNVIFGSTTEFNDVGNDGGALTLYIEDYDGSPGVSGQHGGKSPSDTVFFLATDTGVTRSGGSDVSLIITPSIHLGTSIMSRYLIFDYPIYATTASKTYTIFFKSKATTEWTSSPTAAQLYLEFEAWGHATNNFRKITKSTGTVDMTTDTDFDQSIAVTVAPAQVGVAYLRLYYAKAKEACKDNIFYIDTKVVIS